MIQSKLTCKWRHINLEQVLERMFEIILAKNLRKSFKNLGNMNIELRQTWKVNEKKKIKHGISFFQRKTNFTLLVKLNKFPYGLLTNYFLLEIPLCK